MQIANCRFNNFLNSAVSINSNEKFILSNQKNYNYHEAFSLGHLKIEQCSFENCRSRGHSGGAIFSICPTFIKNSYFYYCFADEGGALCVFSDLDIINTNSHRCSSINGGFLSGKFGSLSINSSAIQFCTSSESGGGINFKESEKLQTYNINLSLCTSDSYSSLIYYSGRIINIYNSIFSFSKSINRIGGICIFVNNNQGVIVQLKDCIFSKMKAKKTSTSLYVDDKAQYYYSELAITNCYFFKCSKKNKIGSVHCRRISLSTVTNCVFSNSFDIEFNGSYINDYINNSFNGKNRFNLKRIPKWNFLFAPHPYILSMDYVLEFVNAIRKSILFSLRLSFFILLIYEIVFVFKKIRINIKIK